MHRTSHWLGLDVHDAGKYNNSLKKEDLTPIKFKNRNVLTVEPGCYIRPSKDIPKEFWGIGIRIEDDVAVGEKNPQILSINAPKEVNELESLVGSFGE